MTWLRGLIRQEIATVTTQITHAATTKAAQVARDIVSLQIDLHERGFRRIGDKLMPPTRLERSDASGARLPFDENNLGCAIQQENCCAVVGLEDERTSALSDDVDGICHVRVCGSAPVRSELINAPAVVHLYVHASSPVVADAGAATPVDPALTVQEGIDGVTPAVGVAGACDCAAPASTSNQEVAS